MLTKRQLANRNKQIYKRYTQQGVRAIFLAQEYGLSRARIYEIIHSEAIHSVKQEVE